MHQGLSLLLLGVQLPDFFLLHFANLNLIQQESIHPGFDYQLILLACVLVGMSLPPVSWGVI